MSAHISRRAHPHLYALNIERHRLQRTLSRYLGDTAYAMDRIGINLPHRIVKHQSLLQRKLSGVDPRLQSQKVQNLARAAEIFDRIIIRPGETFSYWKLLGKPTARRGFTTGMLLSQGEVIEGIGGGLCQMANLLYWMVLHTPLTVTERYRHSFDAFPDEGRVLPFGSGATVFYNYIDLAFRNDTPYTFEIRVWLTDSHLKGEIRSTVELPEKYSVFEKEHAYYTERGTERKYRGNELWRTVIDKRTGNTVRDEFILKNFCEMKYEVPEGQQALPISSFEVDIRSKQASIRLPPSFNVDPLGKLRRLFVLPALPTVTQPDLA